MRLVTKPGFDGIVCAMLLRQAGVIDDFELVPTRLLYSGQVSLGPNDILANTGYIPGCGLWFDHHMEPKVRRGLTVLPAEHPEGADTPGERRAEDSCARIIYDYYGGDRTFPSSYRSLMATVDRMDSGNLSILEIKNPWGWALLGFLCDPVTGLEIGRRFETSYEEMTRLLVNEWRNLPVDRILSQPSVTERIHVYAAQSLMFRDMVRANTRIVDNVTITDFRNVKNIYAGNRFTIYSLYPEQNVSIWIRYDAPAGTQAAPCVSGTMPEEPDYLRFLAGQPLEHKLSNFNAADEANPENSPSSADPDAPSGEPQSSQNSFEQTPGPESVSSPSPSEQTPSPESGKPQVCPAANPEGSPSSPDLASGKPQVCPAANPEGSPSPSVSIGCGLSVINRTCLLHVGKAMQVYDGEGHRQVGFCHVPVEDADRVIANLVEYFRMPQEAVR